MERDSLRSSRREGLPAQPGRPTARSSRFRPRERSAGSGRQRANGGSLLLMLTVPRGDQQSPLACTSRLTTADDPRQLVRKARWAAFKAMVASTSTTVPWCMTIGNFNYNWATTETGDQALARSPAYPPARRNAPAAVPVNHRLTRAATANARKYRLRPSTASGDVVSSKKSRQN